MSEVAPENAACGKEGMPQADVDFLIACLKNTTGGSVSVDTTKVAEALGYKNHRSVSNRISALKKKYNIPFGSSAKGADGGTPPSKASSVGTAVNEPAVPSTPSKQRVTKARAASATSSTKKKGTVKAPKKQEVKVEVKGEDEVEDEDEGSETLSVQDPKRLTDEELFFGKKGQSSDEQDDQNEEDGQVDA